MTRTIVIFALVAVAGCAEPLKQTKVGITDACVTLNDATVEWLVDFVAGELGIGTETAEARAKRQELCERAAAPVDPTGELGD